MEDQDDKLGDPPKPVGASEQDLHSNKLSHGCRNPQESPNTPPSQSNQLSHDNGEGVGEGVRVKDMQQNHLQLQETLRNQDGVSIQVIRDSSYYEKTSNSAKSENGARVSSAQKPQDILRSRNRSSHHGSQLDQIAADSKEQSKMDSSYASEARIKFIGDGEGVDTPDLDKSQEYNGGQSTVMQAKPHYKQHMKKNVMLKPIKTQPDHFQDYQQEQSQNCQRKYGEYESQTPAFALNNSKTFFQTKSGNISQNSQIDNVQNSNVTVTVNGQIQSGFDQHSSQIIHQKNLGQFQTSLGGHKQINIDSVDNGAADNGKDTSATVAEQLIFTKQVSFQPTDADLKQPRQIRNEVAYQKQSVEKTTPQMTQNVQSRQEQEFQQNLMTSPDPLQKFWTAEMQQSRFSSARRQHQGMNQSPAFQNYSRTGPRRDRTMSGLESEEQFQRMIPRQQPTQVISMAPRPQQDEKQSQHLFKSGTNQAPYPTHTYINGPALQQRARQNQLYESPRKVPQSPFKRYLQSPMLNEIIDHDHENVINGTMQAMQAMHYYKTEKPLKQLNYANNTPRRPRLDSANDSVLGSDNLHFHQNRELDFTNQELQHEQPWAIAAINQRFSPLLNNLNITDNRQDQVIHSTNHFGQPQQSLRYQTRAFHSSLQVENSQNNSQSRHPSHIATNQSSMGGQNHLVNLYEGHKNAFQTPVKDSHHKALGNSVNKEVTIAKRRVNDSNRIVTIQTSSPRLPTTITNGDGSDHINGSFQVQQTPTIHAFNARDQLIGSESARRKLFQHSKFNTTGKPRAGESLDGQGSVNDHRNLGTPLESILPEKSDQDQRFLLAGQHGMHTPLRRRNYGTPKSRSKTQARNVEHQNITTPENVKIGAKRSNRRAANNMDTPSSLSKQQTGLKTIAREVTEILKGRQFMTYNEAAVIIVNKHLKEQNDSGNENNDSHQNHSQNQDGSPNRDSQSNLNSTAMKERNSSPSRKKMRNQDQRSKREDNLRRRIYDAWNVLKAASIIVDHDDKNYWMNQNVLKSLVSYSSDSETDSQEDIADLVNVKSPLKSKRKKLQDSSQKKDLEQTPSGIQLHPVPMSGDLNRNNDNQIERKGIGSQPQDMEDDGPNEEGVNGQGPCVVNQEIEVTADGRSLVTEADYLEEIKSLKQGYSQRFRSVKSKLRDASNQVKNILETKRLIKRNKKMKEAAEKSTKRKKSGGNKHQQSLKAQSKQGQDKICKIIHIPFIVLNYFPEKFNMQELAENELPSLVYNRKHCSVVSVKNFIHYGDMTILKFMRERNLIEEYDMVDILGQLGDEINSTFQRAVVLTDNYRDTFEKIEIEMGEGQPRA